MGNAQLYDPNQTYQWNFDNAPKFTEAVDADPFSPAQAHRFLGIPCRSPLGVPAGPLLNSDWVLHYSNLGYDILTYKTVRSRERECYPVPNLQPVQCGQLSGPSRIVASVSMTGSWAISFGMPSKAPIFWVDDVRRARESLPLGKLLTVSVVATPEEDWALDQIAGDYADVARQAVAAGADTIEANFSCPNVSTADGQLFQDDSSASVVARRIRQAIGETPLTLKIGHIVAPSTARRLLDATADSIDGLSMVNCIAANVITLDGQMAFEGQARGVGGVGIRDAVLKQVQLFAPLAEEYGIELVGVGGVSTPADYQALLAAGVSSVQIATAAMLDPELPKKIRKAVDSNRHAP
jgi:dihydroorotate dehydrogenase